MSGIVPTVREFDRGRPGLDQACAQLAGARDLPAIAEVVRHAARAITGADGATFVLRDDDRCYYVAEDAVGPLWVGERFPLESCISGWAMLNSRPAVIEDIYSDPRIPHAAYRRTFVASLAMVPVRIADPLAAIGNYWSRKREATAEEVGLLEDLAAAVAEPLERVQVLADVRERSAARNPA